MCKERGKNPQRKGAFACFPVIQKLKRMSSNNAFWPKESEAFLSKNCKTLLKKKTKDRICNP